jgi:drug/metabolite transporter (DMT)-like permease
MKSFPIVVLIGPWLIARAHGGKRVMPPPKVLGALVLAGLLGQLMGNVLFQWSLGVVGIALTTPLMMGSVILVSAAMGRAFLSEPVTARTAASILLLITAIAVLSWGAGDAHSSMSNRHESVAPAAKIGLLAAGVSAACMSGLAYAVLSVVIRYGVTRKASVPATMFTIGLVGLISLGALSCVRSGASGMWNTSPRDLAMMLLAGVCNAAAFLALTKALQLIAVVYVNAFGAAQVALSALAGVVFFDEALSSPMVSGVALTAVGLLLMRQGRRTRRAPDASPPSDEARRRSQPRAEAASAVLDEQTAFEPD